MIVSRSSEGEGKAIRTIEGQPIEGRLLVNPRLRGAEMTLLEVHFSAGARSLLHAHDHESLVYVIRGRVRMTVGSEVHVLGPGDACLNPRGVAHGVESLEDSMFIEVKSPVPNLDSVLGR